MKQKAQFSATFLFLAVLFTVCLITSNLLATKVFAIGAKIALPCAVLVFLSLTSSTTALLRCTATARPPCDLARIRHEFLVVMFGQIAVWLPAAGFWKGGEHFNFVFGMAPRVVFASLFAFLAGSTLNSLVLSKMKVASGGRRFGWRAIVSSICGELCDSAIFMPIAFWEHPQNLSMDDARAGFLQGALRNRRPAAYSSFVKRLKTSEGIDVYDEGISYNPFKIKDLS